METKIFEVFDSHHHIWSSGEAEFPWAVQPIDALKSKGTLEEYLSSTKIDEDGKDKSCKEHREHSVIAITKSLIVQPMNHKFDHAYLFDAIKRYPDRFLGMALANPEEGVSGLQRLKEISPSNLVGIRFNPSLFPGGNLESNLAEDMFSEASTLRLVVGVMCFTGISEHINSLRKWALKCPGTKIVIDHMGFFRQPAVGAILDTKDKVHNIEEHWKALMSLVDLPNVYIKISALFRLSGEPFPHYDLRDRRVKVLVESFGADRLMWGSDWPYVLTGNQMGMSNFSVENIKIAASIFEKWNEPDEIFSEIVIKKIMFQTGMQVFNVNEY